MSSVEFKSRRDRIFNKIDNHSVVIMFAGVAKTRSADATFPFEVNRNFYYLTGIKQENAVLVLVKSDGERKEFLFIDEYSEVKEKWIGKKLTVDEAREISGINNTLIYNSLPTKLDSIIKKEQQVYGEIDKLYMDLSKELKVGEELSTKECAQLFLKKYPFLELVNIYSILVNERMIKSPYEVEQIKEAIDITYRGILKMFKESRHGIFEYELANVFGHSILNEGTHQFAFDTIVAGGINATCLHYPTPYDSVNGDELILCDLGAAYNNYCADISRTFPCNGKFTDLQRTIYNVVLSCNKYIIDNIKPGITLKELQDLTIEFLGNELVNAHVIKNKDEINKYYYHGVSHHLGLDTHDVCDRNKPLEPGNVITVEPGLYFKEYKIGIRIEDDVLVTQTGRENLSIGVVKEIDEIEGLMATRK